jgi:hypothetical protein
MQDDLDAVIREASDYLNKNVPGGSKLVILNIKSSYLPLSEYIIDMLTGNVVNDHVFTVVDRANLALIQQEMDFQLSGEVSDESAQTIVSGAITAFGKLWRMTIRALDVEGATVQGMFNRNISNGASVAVLTSGAPVAAAEVPRRVASVQPAAAPAPPAFAPAPSGGTPAAPAPAPALATVTYKVGGRGPADGYIFYDKGTFSDGWRYLEAAPRQTEFKAAWVPNRTVRPPTATGIGTGKRNTEIIVNFMREIEAKGGAASLCDSLVAEGFDDWFLPSKDELNLMYKNLHSMGLGGFNDEFYWSSSESYPTIAWYQRFSDGAQYYYDKNTTGCVRAVRAF